MSDTIGVQMPLMDAIEYMQKLGREGRLTEHGEIQSEIHDTYYNAINQVRNLEFQVEELQNEMEIYERDYKNVMPLDLKTFDSARDAAYAVVMCLPANENPLIQDDEQYLDEGNQLWRTSIKYENLDTGEEGWYSVMGTILEGDSSKYLPIYWCLGCDFDRSLWLERDRKAREAFYGPVQSRDSESLPSGAGAEASEDAEDSEAHVDGVDAGSAISKRHQLPVEGVYASAHESYEGVLHGEGSEVREDQRG